MHESVPVGGIVIFDDVMSHPPVTRCWTDFKREQNLTENLQQIDRHSAWFRKERVVKIDMTHFRAPQDANKQMTKSAGPETAKWSTTALLENSK
jgi:hypothetical protein